MCGRYEFFPDIDIDELIQITDAIDRKYQNKDATYKTGEIFPTDRVPVLAHGPEHQTVEPFLMNWGFPKWDGKGVVINARSETAAEKKMFAKALARRRCIIPANGFFEWQKRDQSKPKDKFRFTANDQPLLYMAGLYSLFAEGDTKKASFVILTKEANVSMSDIHDRMPVILAKSEIEPWLTDDSFVSLAFARDVRLQRQATNQTTPPVPEQLSLTL